jgi:peptidoglycan/LPS O-acetylase OafA/YrhL
MQIQRLNTIRGIAVLIVLVSHYSNESQMLGGVLGNGAGQFGVMLFFLLSSFLISFLYADRIPNSQNIVNFCVARIARVIPLFLLVVFLSFFANLLLPINVSKFLYPIANFSSLFSHLLLLSGVSVLWTIGPEIQFYLLFAVLWWLSKWLRNMIILFPIIFIGLYVFFPNPTVYEGTVFGLFLKLSILQVYAYFSVGLLLGVLYKKWSVPDQYKSKYFLCALVVIPLMYPMIFRSYMGYSHKLWADPWVLVAVSLVFFSLVFLVPDNPLLENKVGDFLGKVSYSAYLVHYPILLALKEFGFAKDIMNGIFFLVLTLAVSLLSFRYFEYPARTLIRNWFSLNNTYANLGGSLVVGRCIDTPKCQNCAINR